MSLVFHVDKLAGEQRDQVHGERFPALPRLRPLPDWLQLPSLPGQQLPYSSPGWRHLYALVVLFVLAFHDAHLTLHTIVRNQLFARPGCSGRTKQQRTVDLYRTVTFCFNKVAAARQPECALSFVTLICTLTKSRVPPRPHF